MDLLNRAIRHLYGIGNDPILVCDAVIALGYGLTIHRALPDAERKVLDEARKIAVSCECPVHGPARHISMTDARAMRIASRNSI